MKWPLYKKIFAGMIIGSLAGIILRNLVTDVHVIDNIISYVKPLGDVFMRMIFMMVIPLITTGLIIGIADLGDLKRLGKIGLITLTGSIVITSVSVFIGISMANVFKPGNSLSVQDRQILLDQYGSKTQNLATQMTETQSRSVMDILVSIVPKNPLEEMVNAFNPNYSGGGLLAIMFFSVIIGIALAKSDKEKTNTLKQLVEGAYDVIMKVIGMAMQLAPYGVAALLFALTAKMGIAIFSVLLQYVLVVISALIIHQFITYSLVLKYVSKLNPIRFYKNISEVMLTAFSTSSSNATLPTAIRVTHDKVGLPKDITNFVLTVGSTANQNGTALYEGVTVLFLAQCFGVQLDLSQQIIVVLISILSGIGTAGVPGGSLPVIMLILVSVGIPAESIAIIYGVDRLLDMCRTTLNVTGDIVIATAVHQLESGNKKN
jgi:DAACS family dicarboxylate/amino acid:cation (Na+ or H+) symporter